MARSSAAPIGELKEPVGARSGYPFQEQLLASERINLGMNTSIDPADLQNGELQLAKNARVRYDRTSRRAGTSLITPVKPNSNPVIGLIYFKKSDGTQNTIRVTRNSIHKRGVGWTAFTAGVNGSWVGADTDIPQFAVAFDRLFAVNNGVDEIQEFDVSANQYKRLNTSAGVSTKYKYITAFYNRVVGAYLTGSPDMPTQVGWSGDANLSIWDAATDETAGQGPLVESPSDLADYITGLFGFTNFMMVLREQSIWMATKNPIPNDPFNFYAAFPGIGCDCPHSAVVTVNALCWLDTRTKAVWAYSPNDIPARIGTNVEKTIISAINDPSQVFAGFDPVNMEYYIGIPLAGSNFTRLWVYSFKTKAWTYDEVEGVVEIVVAPLGAGILSISELAGVVSGLTGSISSLTSGVSVAQNRLYGRSDGEITEEDLTNAVQTDPSFAGSTGVYTTDLISKDFEVPETDTYFSKLRFEVVALSAGTLTIQYAKNGSGNWKTAKTYTFQAGDIGIPKLIKFVKQIKARRFTWRLTTTSGYFDLLEYEIQIFQSGLSRK